MVASHSTKNLSWAACSAFVSGRLITINKQPGFCLVVVRETWRRLFYQCVLKFTVPEATNACQGGHICAGLNGGIGGAIHSVRYIWDANVSTENWGFILADTKITFNEINCVAILWTVRHLWPSGARFIPKCCRQWSLRVLCNGN